MRTLAKQIPGNTIQQQRYDAQLKLCPCKMATVSMAINKTSSGWQVDIQPGGRGHRRIRKTFESKAEALRFERWIQAKASSGKPWEPKPKDRRKLTDLIDRWHALHGNQLRDGEGRKRILEAMVLAMGNPMASSMTAKLFTEYRAARLKEGIRASTVNHEHAYLRAMFRELTRLGEWQQENPIAQVRQIKTQDTELAWLDRKEIARLLVALKQSRNTDAIKVSRLCLATGARWSEAEGLTAEQLFNDRVQFGNTKAGKIRVVPVRPRLAKSLRTQAQGRLFSSCYSAFRKAVDRAELKLPSGQLAHVLRHTFASHFMQRGGSILVLQRILGHSDIRMTMRYAHFAPEHLAEAAALNPLAPLTIR